MSAADAAAGAALTRLVAIRHGQTAWNAIGRIQGQTDIALDALGRRQAARLAAALAHEGLDAVVSSDLSRAHETARALAAPLGLAVTLDAGLRERGFGRLEGRTHDEIPHLDPDGAARWRARDPHWRPPGGESLVDVRERVLGCVARLAAAHRGATLALVCHGGVLDQLHRAALHLPLQAPRGWALANCGINRLLHGEHGLTIVGWNDVAHLADLDAAEAPGAVPGRDAGADG